MQDRRRFLTALAGVPTASMAASGRLNILFITSDDLGLQLSCYGETRIRTPNLDRLAASGVRFQTAYVTQASCSPSRSSMFTGLYPHANGQYGLANTGFQLHPRLQAATLPAVLKRHGYRTGILGKLHVEPENTFPFDHSERDSGATRMVRHVARKAGDFLRSASDVPFFLMVNFSDPHAFRSPSNPREWHFPPQVDGLPEKPILPSETSVFPFQQIDTAAQRERVANYYNAVLRLDAGVGMLMEQLDQSGHAENTLIIFCGDHGPPFSRGKTTCYEAALRVPFLVRWPGVSRPSTSPAFVSTIDIAPTIFDAANIRPPVPMHGRSLRPVVRQPGARWRQYLAGEFHFHGANPFYPRRAIRDTRYKLIHNLLAGKSQPSTGIDGDQAFQISRQERYAGTAVRRAFDTFASPPEFELYDLESDPVEFHNLAGRPETKSIEQRLTAALRKWRGETGDPFLDAAFLERMAREGAPASRNRR